VTVVKVCGLRELPHMLAAADAGADLLGINFVPGARRQVTPEQGREMARAFRETHVASGPLTQNEESRVARDLGASLGAGLALLVGLFADQPASEVNQVAEAVGLDAVQLCGDEPPEYWARIERPILKVVPVIGAPEGSGARRDAFLAALDERLRAVADAGHLAILDRRSETPGDWGGTGHTFDWTIARDLAAAGHRFLLAGGLNPENVGAAIETVAPFGVDVSSGVETDGVKDVERIRAFVEAARGSEARHG
jgi:phosphoribosylanthranilate isomerase